MPMTPTTWRRNAAAVSLVITGLVGGGVLANSVAANAADSTTTSSAASATADSSTATSRPALDESRSQRSDEQLLTGTDAEQARAAALAKYPGATIQRVETDSAGVYEAHIVTADGQRLIVQLDKDFAVTGTDSRGGGTGAPGTGSAAPAAPTAPAHQLTLPTS